MTIVASLLVLTVIGIPFAIVYLIRRTVTLQSIVIEELGGTAGLRRSAELVRGSGLRVLAIGALVNGTVALLGPVIGVAMMFVTPASLGVINLVSSLVYVFVLPAAGIVIALLFYDLRIRAGAARPTTLLAVDQLERLGHVVAEGECEVGSRRDDARDPDDRDHGDQRPDDLVVGYARLEAGFDRAHVRGRRSVERDQSRDPDEGVRARIDSGERRICALFAQQRVDEAIVADRELSKCELVLLHLPTSIGHPPARGDITPRR